MRLAFGLACALSALGGCKGRDPPSHAARAASTPASAAAPLSRERCVAADCNAAVMLHGEPAMHALVVAGGRLTWGTNARPLEPMHHISTIAKSGGAPTTLASGLRAVADIAVEGDFVYFVEVGFPDATLQRIGLSGGPPEPLATCDGYHGLAFTSSEVIYVSRNRKLMAMPKKGGGARELGRAFYATRVQLLGDTVYWSAEDGLYRSRSGRPERVLAAQDPWGFAVTRDYLVLNQGGDQRGLFRARPDGSELRPLYGSNVSRLAADGSHAYVALRERGQWAIRRIALRDGEMALLARRAQGSDTSTIAFALDETHVYFADSDEGILWRVPK
jgi:hypothetical protein